MSNKIRLVLSISAAAIVLCCVAVILFVTFAPPKAAELSLSLSPTTLTQSSSKALNLNCSRDDATFTYEVYDSNIARVENGIVFALNVGSTSVRVTAAVEKDRAVATANIIVTEDPDGALVAGLDNHITLYLLDKNFNEAYANGLKNEVTFVPLRSYSVSSTNRIVTITKNSIIASKEGTTLVTFTSTNSDSTFSTMIEVKKVDAHLEKLPNEIVLSPKGSVKLDYSIAPSYYTGSYEIEFSTSENVEYRDGMIYALNSGSGFVKLKLDEVEYNIPVIISSGVSITLTPVSGCNYEGNSLIVNSGVKAVFMLQVYDADLNAINFSRVRFVGDITIERSLNYLMLTATKSSTIALYVDELFAGVTINIICKDE